MRKIYIHIGCGKTGSSALQLWFNQISNDLKLNQIIFPSMSGVSSDYQITSGNAIDAINQIYNGTGLQYFKQLIAKYSHGDLLISSEWVSSLSSQYIEEFRSILVECNLNPIIIAYVRDVYDFSLSVYHQLLKRHGSSCSFEEFVTDYDNQSILTQHLDVVDAFSKYFEDIRVLHYDKVKDNLDYSFAEILGIDLKKIPRMHKKTINRSLSSDEVLLLRTLNALFRNKFGDYRAGEFATLISDSLIYSDPEKECEFIFNQEVYDYLDVLMSERILKFNSLYFAENDGIALTHKAHESKKQSYSENNSTALIALNKIFTLIDVIEISGIKVNSNKINGCLDVISERTIFGWALSRKHHTPVVVILYLNDQFLSLVLANEERPDITNACGTNCAFSFKIPSHVKLATGDKIRARVVGEDQDLDNSPIVILDNQ